MRFDEGERNVAPRQRVIERNRAERRFARMMI
jgi:hypothetical protein